MKKSIRFKHKHDRVKQAFYAYVNKFSYNEEIFPIRLPHMLIFTKMLRLVIRDWRLEISLEITPHVSAKIT
jgi:hypothetical protein